MKYCSISFNILDISWWKRWSAWIFKPGPHPPGSEPGLALFDCTPRQIWTQPHWKWTEQALDPSWDLIRAPRLPGPTVWGTLVQEHQGPAFMQNPWGEKNHYHFLHRKKSTVASIPTWWNNRQPEDEKWKERSLGWTGSSACKIQVSHFSQEESWLFCF